MIDMDGIGAKYIHIFIDELQKKGLIFVDCKKYYRSRNNRYYKFYICINVPEDIFNTDVEGNLLFESADQINYFFLADNDYIDKEYQTVSILEIVKINNDEVVIDWSKLKGL